MRNIKEEYIFGIIILLLVIGVVSAIGSSSYNLSNPTIGGGASVSSDSYATGVVIGEIAENSSSTSYANCVGFECTVGHSINTSEITLNSGWNLISLDMRQGNTGTDRNISLVAGWNLIGHSSISANTTLSNAKFHDGTTEYTWAEALANGKQQAYLSYLDTETTANDSKYKYVSTLSGFDDDSLRANKGYWIYSNVSGNLTLPSVGGSYSNATYAWSQLYFRNGSGVVKGISDAGTAGWITSTKYWHTGDEDFRNINSVGIGNDKTTISAWEGIFIKSNFDNMTLIRQN
jgi:hypothetical protein